METKNRTKTYLGSLLKVVAGATTVIGGAYVVSRIKEKQDAEARIERLEQMVEGLSSREETAEG